MSRVAKISLAWINFGALSCAVIFYYIELETKKGLLIQK
jgi:hypothetical protein